MYRYFCTHQESERILIKKGDQRFVKKFPRELYFKARS